MSAPKDPTPGVTTLDSIRVRIAMIAAEKIRAGVPAERAVAEAAAQFHADRGAPFADPATSNRSGGKTR